MAFISHNTIEDSLVVKFITSPILEADDGTKWTPFHSFYELPRRYKVNTQNDILVRLDIEDVKQLNYYNAYRDASRFTFIKLDGTLWKGDGRWINFDVDSKDPEKPTILSIDNPQQIGSRSDWVCLSFSSGMTADGKIWNWTLLQRNRWNPFPARFRHKMVLDLSPQGLTN